MKFMVWALLLWSLKVLKTWSEHCYCDGWKSSKHGLSTSSLMFENHEKMVSALPFWCLKAMKTVWALPFWWLTPEGRPGCLMSPPCLESQGCHLIPLFYPLSCSYLPLLLFLSCPFFLLMSHSPDILKILHYFLLRNRVFSFVVVFWLLFSS